MSKEYWENRYETILESGRSGSMSLEVDDNMREFFGYILKSIDPIPCKRVIDFGCGSGKMSDFLAMFYKAEYIGYDIVDSILESNRKRLNHKFINIENEDLKKCDVIWCCFVLQHLKEGEINGVLARFNNALRKGGKVYIVNTMCQGTDSETMFYRGIDWYCNILKKHGFDAIVRFVIGDVVCLEVERD